MSKKPPLLKIAIIAFILLFLTKFLFAKMPVQYGEGEVTVGSVLLLLYSCYLIYISCAQLNKTYIHWTKQPKWINKLLLSYVLLISGAVSITILIFSNGGPLSIISEMGMNALPAFYIFFSWGGMAIAFPTSLYTIYLGVKALVHAKKHTKKSYPFGITLLSCSLIFLAFSSVAIAVMIRFWVDGGLGG